MALLAAQEIRVVADVRSHPVSRWSPHFAKASLAALLAAHGVEYRFFGRELGGRPGRPDTPEFVAAIADVVALAGERRTAILCAEEDPEHCHRTRLLVPALRRAGAQPLHLRGDGRVEDDATGQLALF